MELVDIGPIVGPCIIASALLGLIVCTILAFLAAFIETCRFFHGKHYFNLAIIVAIIETHRFFQQKCYLTIPIVVTLVQVFQSLLEKVWLLYELSRSSILLLRELLWPDSVVKEGQKPEEKFDSEMERLGSQAYMAIHRTEVPVNAKIKAMTELKQEIKHRHCPEDCIPIIFNVIRLSLVAPHLADAGFSILSHLTKRLLLQNLQAPLEAHAVRLFPIILDRLGDAKDRMRQRAVGALSDFYSVSEDTAKEVELLVREKALTSKHPRAKESGMQWVLSSHKEKGMLFRLFVPHIVDCLEDGDGGVRRAAQNTIIELFQDAGSRSTNDLQKRLEQRNVRKTIVAHITSELELGPPVEPELPPSILKHSSGPPSQQTHILPTSNPGDPPLEAPPMSVSEQEAVQLEPLYYESTRDLEEVFREMHPWFEGKEEEHNWLRREKSILKLRRITKGNAPKEYPGPFNSGIKSLLDGILKTVNSLRTTVCTIGCHLVQDLARVCGPSLDNMVEIMLQNLIKLCGNTKKISATKANDTVSAILTNVTYHVRLVQHIHNACQDKNVQPRTFACGWLKIIITKHGHHGSPIDHAGGLDLIEKCIKSGLADSNPSVREKMRSTYWAFARVWWEKSETLMSGLDPKAQDLLVKDASNPNPHKSQSTAAAPGGKSVFSKSTGSAPNRPSIKETIAAQKRAKAAGKNLPERPGSAESFASPAKLMAPARPATAMSTASRHVSTQSTGTLSSAPVRPRRRADIARPNTADSNTRKAAKTPTPQSSPATSPAKSKPKTPGLATGIRKLAPKKVESPSTSPARALPSKRLSFAEPSPTKAAEDFTMVIPNFKDASQSRTLQGDSEDGRQSLNEEPPPRLSPSKILDQDNFTPRANDRQGATRSVSPAKLANDIHRMSINEDVLSPMSLQTDLGNGRTSPPKDTQRISMSPRSIVSRKENLSPRDEYMQEQRPLKVYEDLDRDAASRSPLPSPLRPPRVLEELPVNEPANQHRNLSDHLLLAEQHEGPTPDYHVGWKAAQQKEQAELKRANVESGENPLHARRTLESGIVRIQAKSIDVLGFRKLQNVVRSAGDGIWEDGYKFEELLMPLLEYLEAPIDDSRKSQDLKTQALFTLRLMQGRQQYFKAFYPQALCAILVARRHYPSFSHIVSGLEETAEILVEGCEPHPCIDAVCDLLDVDPNPETRTMGLYVLAGLLPQERAKSRTHEANEENGDWILRLGAMACRFMADTDPNVRRAVMEYIIELHETVDEDIFWGLISSSKAEHRGLITYYLARHRAAAH